METSVYDYVELNFANNLYKTWKGILPQGLQIRSQASLSRPLPKRTVT